MKQVIVLRRDLQMSTGKLTVQACHASVAAVLGAKKAALESWNVEGQTKIVLEVNSLAELQNLRTRCEQVGILHVLISDAGRTELAPELSARLPSVLRMTCSLTRSLARLRS
jgi:PTH2 family peptidyl-tRNA hydrolase